jgi:hypothetical protein
LAESFTYPGYRQLIREYLTAGYHFARFPEAIGLCANSSQPLVLMRHDIDFDLSAALDMAQVEHEEGIQSTYFFLLRTEHYNVLSREGTAAVQGILDLGHNLGLHFDCGAYSEEATEDELCGACAREVALCELWFGRRVEIVSYHRPSPLVLTGNPALSAPLPHAYMACFTQQMKYCSDSRGEWRHGAPQSLAEFRDRKPMQILIHPVWWSSSPRQAQETLRSWLDRRICWLDESIAANCAIYRKRGGETAE